MHKENVYLEVIYPSIAARNTRLMTMDEIYEIRLERFRQLMKDRFGNKQATLADGVGRSPNYISRVLAGDKKLGEEIVRQIEEALRLPAYWFDARETKGAWPFKSVAQTQFDALTAAQREGIEQHLKRQVDAFSPDVAGDSKSDLDRAA